MPLTFYPTFTPVPYLPPPLPPFAPFCLVCLPHTHKHLYLVQVRLPSLAILRFCCLWPFTTLCFAVFYTFILPRATCICLAFHAVLYCLAFPFAFPLVRSCLFGLRSFVCLCLLLRARAHACARWRTCLYAYAFTPRWQHFARCLVRVAAATALCYICHAMPACCHAVTHTRPVWFAVAFAYRLQLPTTFAPIAWFLPSCTYLYGSRFPLPCLCLTFSALVLFVCLYFFLPWFFILTFACLPLFPGSHAAPACHTLLQPCVLYLFNCHTHTLPVAAACHMRIRFCCHLPLLVALVLCCAVDTHMPSPLPHFTTHTRNALPLPLPPLYLPAFIYMVYIVPSLHTQYNIYLHSFFHLPSTNIFITL